MSLPITETGRMFSLFARLPIRTYCGKIETENRAVEKSVFVSQSNDIYTNLALEDWLYRNFDFSKHHILMLWKNNPCVVIGRYQNPWVEANVNNLTNSMLGIQLARRNSGGGTVYHDMGNLNLTFFTPRESYCRKYNLEVIKKALFREYGVKVSITSREDLVIRDSKISGTASKLGRLNSYHHCTLLVDVNKALLREILQKDDSAISSRATKSIKSKITNLSEEDPKITVDGLSTAIGYEYLRTPPYSKSNTKEAVTKSKGFQMINPTEKWFPGIEKLRDDLRDWNWCYGKTPKFSISRSYVMPKDFTNTFSEYSENINVTMVVENGVIDDVILNFPKNFLSVGFDNEQVKVISNLKGCRFREDILNSLEHYLGSVDGICDKDKFVGECVKRIMASV